MGSAHKVSPKQVKRHLAVPPMSIANGLDFLFRQTSGEDDAAQLRQAQQVFLQRRHISQDDTISLGSYEDLTHAAGRTESPAHVFTSSPTPVSFSLAHPCSCTFLSFCIK